MRERIDYNRISQERSAERAWEKRCWMKKSLDLAILEALVAHVLENNSITQSIKVHESIESVVVEVSYLLHDLAKHLWSDILATTNPEKIIVAKIKDLNSNFISLLDNCKVSCVDEYLLEADNLADELDGLKQEVTSLTRQESGKGLSELCGTNLIVYLIFIVVQQIQLNKLSEKLSFNFLAKSSQQTLQQNLEKLLELIRQIYQKLDSGETQY